MDKRVLVACEESQAVTSELRRGGGLKRIAVIYFQHPAGIQNGTYKPMHWKSAKCNGIWF